MADRIRVYDRACICLAKKRTEVNMTRNSDMVEDVLRSESLMEIRSKKIWHELKDHFRLWTYHGGLSIKRKGDILVLVTHPQPPQPPDHSAPDHPHGFIQIIDPETFRKLFGGLLGGGPLNLPDGDQNP